MPDPTPHSTSVPRFVIVEGPIGVGKTTLARRLSMSHGSRLLLEAPEDNPFLPRFYEDPARFALPTQLFFLFQRARQQQAFGQRDLFAPLQVADYLLEKDRLFARVTLDDAEFALYNEVYERVITTTIVPDLLIYLQAPANVLWQRIERRGIAHERLMSEAYLERLCAEYVEFFYRYNQAPILIVNTAEINLADDEGHYRLLLEHIKKGVVGRHFFNPAVG